MINLTLVVQIIHFLIAWWLMQRYLWPYAIAACDQQHDDFKNLKSSVGFAQDQVAIQEAMTVGEWQTIARACRKASKVQELPYEARIVEPVVQERAQASVDEVANKLTKILVDQVPYV